MSIIPAAALGTIPTGLRQELLGEFAKITRNFCEARWEAAELDGGCLCEVIYTIIAGHLDGNNYPSKASKPNNFDEACRRLANAPKGTYSDSARLTIPRVLIGLYDLRNRRGVGHVGGDVSANHMDATYVLHAAKWLMAELVRLFHQVTVADATAVVDALVDRTVPTLWKVGDVTRVLNTSLSLADKTLLLLYHEPQGMSEAKLVRDLEQKRPADYRTRVLKSLHSRTLIEYNLTSKYAEISPTGIQEVEAGLL
ncbi:MAG: hypothetical protein ACRER3_01380 [Pseudomonas fluorescens]